MNRRCFIQMGCYILVCLFLTISTASARVCFLPDSTDCGEGDVAGSGNVDVPCQYSTCPAYNTKYQTCYTERIYNNGGVNVECKQVKCILSESECKKQEADANNSQCCNFDSDSGCYYMGSCKLCNRDVFDSEKNLGEGYDCYPCKDKNGTFYNCTAKEKECNQINSNYTSSCGDSQTAKEVEGIKDSHGNQCYTCKDKPVEKNCSDINKFYKNKDQAKLCNMQAVPIHVVGSDGQCYLCGITESCDGKESKIYYIAYPPYYLKGDVAYESGCKCSSPYLVKGISSNTDPLNPGGPININAISTPGGNSSSTEKIHLPTTLIGVSSSNPYSVKIDEFQCYGEEHCSAQVVKLDVLEKYVPDVAKKLKEDDDYLIDGGNFYDDFYYYTGRQFKPKSQSINTCDDYVVILGNGNPKACAQISSDYYNYHESCPKGLEKKRLPNVYDSTGAQCYTCEKATPVITITYKETYNSLTPSMGADPEEYYYKTLKFTATSSDNISRNILMKTYPAKTCSKPQYTTGSPVTINEGTETIIGSRCGTQSRVLPVSSVAALDTFINGTKVYSFEPYYSSHILYDGLDGKTVETNDYTVKFVKEKTCTPTCTSETGCKYGSKTQSDGCGGTCTVCYPPCAIGYWYGSLAQENCYIKPAKYIKQPSNPHCSKCVCDNGKPDANGHYLQCQYF